LYALWDLLNVRIVSALGLLRLNRNWVQRQDEERP